MTKTTWAYLSICAKETHRRAKNAKIYANGCFPCRCWCSQGGGGASKSQTYRLVIHMHSHVAPPWTTSFSPQREAQGKPARGYLSWVQNNAICSAVAKGSKGHGILKIRKFIPSYLTRCTTRISFPSHLSKFVEAVLRVVLLGSMLPLCPSAAATLHLQCLIVAHFSPLRTKAPLKKEVMIRINKRTRDWTSEQTKNRGNKHMEQMNK